MTMGDTDKTPRETPVSMEVPFGEKIRKPDDPKDGYLWDSPQGLAFYDQGRWLLVSTGQPVST
jgi:hypothetical protein